MQLLSPPAVARADTEAKQADWHRYSFGFGIASKRRCCWISVQESLRTGSSLATSRATASFRGPLEYPRCAALCVALSLTDAGRPNLLVLP